MWYSYTDFVVRWGVHGDHRAGGDVIAVVWRRQQHSVIYIVVVLLWQTAFAQTPHRRAQIADEMKSPNLKKNKQKKMPQTP